MYISSFCFFHVYIHVSETEISAPDIFINRYILGLKIKINLYLKANLRQKVCVCVCVCLYVCVMASTPELGQEKYQW
jgi:hypothetical protein